MEERSGKVWTRGFVILILSNFLLFLNLQMTVPTLPLYAKGQFHASDVAVSLVTSMFALSAIVARVFAGQALQKGKLALLLVIPLAWSNRKLPMPEVKPTAHSKLFDINLLLPMVLNVLLCVTYGGVLSFLALFGKEAQIANVGVFFLCNAVAVVLIRPISGRIFDKKGHVALVIPGGLFVIAALVVLSYSTTTGQLMLASLLYGVGFGVLQPTIQTWMIQKVPAEERGMANGMFLNSMDFGVASGALVLGVIAMRTGYMEMYRFAALFMVVFLFVYAGSLVWRNGKNGVRWKKLS